jgi:hypothetical protein
MSFRTAFAPVTQPPLCEFNFVKRCLLRLFREGNKSQQDVTVLAFFREQYSEALLMTVRADFVDITSQVSSNYQASLPHI